ncbi:MAG TPA: VOC family protein [Thermoanaerobaculia bacterium]|nr:VOC family protein [Thermoanaerobaculia bacterium]
MAEQDRIEQLDTAIEAMLAGRRAEVSGEVAALAAIAADLREVADPRFKASLKWKLVPPARRTMTAHFTVHGAAGLVEFIEEAFGGEEVFRAPAPDGSIAHAVVAIGDSTVEMGDAPKNAEPTRSAIHLYVPNVDELYERALAAGAKAVGPIVDQFYGDREGTVDDRYGNRWYIASPVRAGHRTVTPVLHPHGTGRTIEFVRDAFGGELVEEPYRAPDGNIVHVVMRVGDSLVEMGEARADWAPFDAGIHLLVDDCDAVYARAVAAGARTVRPPYDAPYGERSAYVVDPWGNRWFIGTPQKS